MNTLVITGASSGIGRALALEYASRDIKLLLCGRDADRLDATAAEVQNQGANVELCRIPVDSVDEFAAALRDFDSRHPVDGLFLVAGVKTGNEVGLEPASELHRVLNVNLSAPIFNVQALLPAMIKRGRGQIVLVSSFAALTPQGDLLSYSASKAGVLAYGIALRRKLRGTGIFVTTVLPGFVDTPMTDRQNGPTPMLVSAEYAARRIRRGVQKRRAKIIFPRPLALGISFLELLPTAVSDLINHWFRAEILPDEDERKSLTGRSK